MENSYLIISDIHGNNTALEAVLDDSPDFIDKIICLGDYVGLFGSVSNVIKNIRPQLCHTVIGNHDISVLRDKVGIAGGFEDVEVSITQDTITDEQKEWLLDKQSIYAIENEETLISHASPHPEHATGLTNVDNIRKRDYISVASEIDTQEFNFFFFGHSHQQAMLDCSKFGYDITIANPGAVGQSPYGRADYALYDSGQLSLHSVEYDITPICNFISNNFPKGKKQKALEIVSK